MKCHYVQSQTTKVLTLKPKSPVVKLLLYRDSTVDRISNVNQLTSIKRPGPLAMSYPLPPRHILTRWRLPQGRTTSHEQWLESSLVAHCQDLVSTPIRVEKRGGGLRKGYQFNPRTDAVQTQWFTAALGDFQILGWLPLPLGIALLSLPLCSFYF